MNINVILHVHLVQKFMTIIWQVHFNCWISFLLRLIWVHNFVTPKIYYIWRDTYNSKCHAYTSTILNMENWVYCFVIFIVMFNVCFVYFSDDFFLISQTVNQGTVGPTHYVVVHDKITALQNKQRLYSITYKLCHLYYNWLVRKSYVM